MNKNKVDASLLREFRPELDTRLKSVLDWMEIMPDDGDRSYFIGYADALAEVSNWFVSREGQVSKPRNKLSKSNRMGLIGLGMSIAAAIIEGSREEKAKNDITKAPVDGEHHIITDL